VHRINVVYGFPRGSSSLLSILFILVCLLIIIRGGSTGSGSGGGSSSSSRFLLLRNQGGGQLLRVWFAIGSGCRERACVRFGGEMNMHGRTSSLIASSSSL
jgi:hypothetical protein